MSLEAFDVRDADTPHAIGRRRCSRCETFRLLEQDGLCFGCLNYTAVAVKAHQPADRWMVTHYIGGVPVSREGYFEARAVEHIREMYGEGNVSVEEL